MSLCLFRCLKVAFLLFVLVAQIAFPLKISEDTLKVINRNKFYPIGCAVFDTENPDLSLAEAAGPIGLAKLEYEMHSVIMKKIRSRSLSDPDDFTQAYVC